jgi:hypothetical protein
LSSGGISGTKQHRPETDRVLAAARKEAFDVLLVWRADRPFRSLKHMVLTLDELAALGIDFVSVTEPFDTTTPRGGSRSTCSLPSPSSSGASSRSAVGQARLPPGSGASASGVPG